MNRFSIYVIYNSIYRASFALRLARLYNIYNNIIYNMGELYRFLTGVIGVISMGVEDGTKARQS